MVSAPFLRQPRWPLLFCHLLTSSRRLAPSRGTTSLQLAIRPCQKAYACSRRPIPNRHRPDTTYASSLRSKRRSVQNRAPPLNCYARKEAYAASAGRYSQHRRSIATQGRHRQHPRPASQASTRTRYCRASLTKYKRLAGTQASHCQYLLLEVGTAKLTI